MRPLKVPIAWADALRRRHSLGSKRFKSPLPTVILDT
jgi:hypothetical protein